MQDWITFELAIRIRFAKVYSDISEEAKARLRIARRVLFALLALAFLALSITIIVSARIPENEGWSFA